MTVRSAYRIGLIAFSLVLLGIAGLSSFLAKRPPLLDIVPFSTAYYDRHGILLRLTLADDDKYRLFTPLNDISPALVEATLWQEDRHFYEHRGVDACALIRAAYETYIRRSRPMGGSTITMQTVRLRDRMATRSWPGKARQILEAIRLEHHYSKKQILEAYLNLAPYGGNIHGAGAASLIYFGQPVSKLAVPQSLALAVIPQNPVRRFPRSMDGSAWREARLRLFQRLPDSYNAYKAQMQLPLTAAGPDRLPFAAPHFVDNLTVGTGRIDTTLDFPLQRLLERHVAAWIERMRAQDIDNAAILLVHAPSMEVRALIGSGDFHDMNTGGQVDGTAARRSPGSTLKPFIYALALDQGLIHPETLLSDDPAFFAEYRPGNFDKRFMGAIPAREALTLSRNVPAIALASRLRDPDLYGFLQLSGADLRRDREHYGLSLPVGGAEVTMRTLVRLYAMLANGGVLKDLRLTADQPFDPGRALLSSEAALLTLRMLDQPDPETLPFMQQSGLPVYWKTGTSSGFRDAWTVGVFGPYVLAVWTGHFDGRPSPALVGRETAAPLFFELAAAVSERERLTDQVGPAMARLNLKQVEMCVRTGLPGQCDTERKGWFIPGKSPIALVGRDNDQPEILSPRSGVIYADSRQSTERLRIPLEAKTSSGGSLYWFADNALIGVASGNIPLFWSPEPGEHTVCSVDSRGRSASQRIRVIAVE